MPAKKVFTEEHKAIAERFMAGEALETLAADLGYSNPASVYPFMKRNGYVRRNAKYRQWTQAQVSEIVSLYLSGESLANVAQAFNCSDSAIIKILDEKNVSTRSWGQHRRMLTDEQEAEIFAAYRSGLSSREVGKKFGLDSRTVRALVDARGGGTRSVREAMGGLTDPQITEVVALYKDGESTESLAELYGISGNSVLRALHSFGVTVRVENGTDRLVNALAGERRFSVKRDCSFYVFALDVEGYSKAGIAYDVEKRADDHYGDLHLEKVFSSRIEAFFLEQAVLDATRGNASRPEALANWPGASEIRMMESCDLASIAVRLINEMEELGVWDFAARYVPMTAAQRIICQQRALEGATV